MDLATGAMGSLLGKLGELLVKEYNVQRVVREQVRSLTLELESASAAVRKVAEVPPEQLDEQVRIWAREIREASYDMEDVLDTMLVRVQGGDNPVDQESLFRRLQEKMTKLFARAKARHDIAAAIHDIKKRLEEVSERRGRYVVESIAVKPAATSAVDPRLAAIYKDVTQLVGIDKARADLISMLMLPDTATRMVSIAGVGGLGKTTLAKASYDKIKQRYHLGAFVPVGRNPDLRKVFRDILISLDKEFLVKLNKFNILDERQLIDEIREFLKNKRYLVVIDDVWEIHSVETIRFAFVDNNHGSRVITTTRNFEVAAEAHQCYNLQPLSYDSSKELFYKRIYGGDGRFPDNEQDEVPAKILKRCGGIPLAVITMASLLTGKPREDWCEVYISIGFGNKENREADNTMKILSFSYFDLPFHLRTCLLYLSIFPEDFMVPKSQLIRKWVAEGFVKEKQGEGLFELGERYFNDLVNRCMIMAVNSEEEGIMVYGCRVHDMVLDFIRSVSCEENFITLLDQAASIVPQHKIRRFAHHNSHMENHIDMPQVRSFIACRCNLDKWAPITGFKLLRVLSIEHCRSVKPYHLKHVGNLLHLRYLGLTGTNVYKLPKEIGTLKFLQTLDLVETSIKALPSTIGLLTQLVCLRAPNNSGLDEKSTEVGNQCWLDEIVKLTSMEELEINAGMDQKSIRQFLRNLSSLTELRILRIQIDYVMDGSMQTDLVHSLRNLHKIQHIILLVRSGFVAADIDKWETERFYLHRTLRHLIVQDIMFSRLPLCINPSLLPKLSHLSLYVDAMDEEDIKCLGRLPELCYLKLRTWSTLTVTNISGDLFLKLTLCSMPSSVVQFVPSSEDTCVSFHMWNGEKDTFHIGPDTGDCTKSPIVLPCIEVLEFAAFVRPLMDCNVDCDNLGLKYLISLQKVKVDVNCIDAYAAEVEKLESQLKQTVDRHPNHPTLELRRFGEHRMIPSIQEHKAHHTIDRIIIPSFEEQNTLVLDGGMRISSVEEQHAIEELVSMKRIVKRL